MSTISIPSAGKATAILDAAEELFGRHGFEGLSMNALAQEVGVSKANIFHHFKSKEDLYLTVLYRARRRFVSQLIDLTNNHQNSEQRIQTLSHAYLKQMLEHEPLVKLLMRDLIEKRRPGKSLAERLFADNFVDLLELIREGQARGELRADFNPGMAMLVISAVSLNYLQTREFMHHLPGMEWTRDSEQLADALWDILWHGIAPRT
jgi:TetR/AcrR family transcriptional regulator